MSTTPMPLLYHPTKVVLIDDDERFTGIISEALQSQGIGCVSFTCPKKALNYLESKAPTNKLTVHQQAEDDNPYIDTGVTIDFSAFLLTSQEPDPATSYFGNRPW